MNSKWNAKDTEKKNWVETNISDIIKVQKKNQLFKSVVAQIPKLTITDIITQLSKHMYATEKCFGKTLTIYNKQLNMIQMPVHVSKEKFHIVLVNPSFDTSNSTRHKSYLLG